MYENNMKTDSKVTTLRPQEEFLRQVIFLKDEEKVLAVFPFYHDISTAEYNQVIDTFFDDMDNIPPKNEFCLMNEQDFGWGWIHYKMVTYLEVAEQDDYAVFRDKLVASRIIKPYYILNEN